MNQREQPVRVFGGESFEAGRVQSLLQSEGIDAALVGGNLGAWAPHLAVGGGVDAVQVVVRKEDAERALRLLADQGLSSL